MKSAQNQAHPEESDTKSSDGFCFFGAVTLTMAPLILSIKPLERRFERLPDDTLLLFLAFGGFLAAIIASLVAGLYLFFWLWFNYLRRLPVEERNFAEGKLALSLNLYSMEPQ